MAILTDDMRLLTQRHRHVACSKSLGNRKIILIVVVISAALLAACGGQAGPEPGLSSTPSDPIVHQVTAAPVEAPGDPPIQSLPSPAPTLLQPPSPTPAPTLNGGGMAESDVAATLEAAAHPPTPPILSTTPVESIVNEPMPTPSGVYSWTLKVPILMYHYISEPPPGADIYRVDLSVSPDSFRRQMAYLKDNGFTPIDFYDLSTAIVAQSELPPKPVIITFDDGYRDNYEEAYPILQEFGFKGNFFVVTEFIDAGREGYMTWEMIEEMSRAGQRIESHSRTHPDLTTKSRDGLIWEILGSQETLAAHIGYKPRYFCYPGGTYDEETIQVLRELDFWGAVTTQNGSWHGFNDRFEWRRVRMRYTTSMEEFGKLVDLEGTVSGKTPG